MSESEDEYSFIPHKRPKKVLRFDEDSDEEEYSKPLVTKPNQNNEVNNTNNKVPVPDITSAVKPKQNNNEQKTTSTYEQKDSNVPISPRKKSVPIEVRDNRERKVSEHRVTENKRTMLEKRSILDKERLPSPQSKKLNIEKKTVKVEKEVKEVQKDPVRSKAYLTENNMKKVEPDTSKLPFHKRYGRRHYDYKLPKTKHELVYEILKRWWYCLPNWPKKDADYSEKLKEGSMRVIKENFNFEPE